METVRFETWRHRLQKSITHQSPAWTALHKCTEFAKQPPSQLPKWLVFWFSKDPDWAKDTDNSVLRLMYNITAPIPPTDRRRKKRDAYTRKALKDLAEQAESFVRHLTDTAEEDGTAEKVMVSPDHDFFSGVNLAPLLDAYRNAASASRYFLDVLQRMPHSRKPDVLHPALSLAGLLESRFGVPETGALELGRLCMLAHGHPDEELEEMRNRDKIRDGKFRKRKNASQEKISSMKAKVLRDPNTKGPIELKSITFYVDPTGKK